MQVEATFQDEYYDLPGLSGYCKLCVATLRDHIRRDKLPAYKVRGKILIRRSEFDRWMARFRISKDSLNRIVEEATKGLKNRGA